MESSLVIRFSAFFFGLATEDLFVPRLLFVRGTGFTGSVKESLLPRSASAQRVALVQKTEPSAFLHLMGGAFFGLLSIIDNTLSISQ